MLLAAGAARADDCANQQTQTAMDECAGQAFQRSDAALNAAYRQVAARLKDEPATAKLLVAAERAWVAFRNAECDFSASGVQGGSIYQMVLTMCWDGLTQKRTEALKSYLDCREGDLSCPLPPP